MSCGGPLGQLSGAQLLKIFSNNSGTSPNIYVSIHGGELPAGYVDTYREKVRRIQPGADMRTELTQIFTAIVPDDLIVVKFSAPFCNNAGDAEMEADLRYWWSSPLWTTSWEVGGSGAPAAQLLLNHCTIYGPGQRLYNQWMVFDDSDYLNIFELPHFGDDGYLVDNTPGKGDPKVKVGRLGARGLTLKQWSKSNVRKGEKTNYPKTLHYRHFDMQELLNYLSPSVAGRAPSHKIAMGPHMDAQLVGGVRATDAPPLRVVYFFSCEPGPEPSNWQSLAKKFTKARKGSTAYNDVLLQLTQNVAGGRQVMRAEGRQCYEHIRATLQQQPRSLVRPELKSWRRWCLQNRQRLRPGQECMVIGMRRSAGAGAGGGAGGGVIPFSAAMDHFNLYWAQVMEQGGETEFFPAATQDGSQSGRPDFDATPGVATQEQYGTTHGDSDDITMTAGGGGGGGGGGGSGTCPFTTQGGGRRRTRRRKRRRKRRRTKRRKRRKRRRSKRTHRRHRRRQRTKTMR